MRSVVLLAMLVLPVSAGATIFWEEDFENHLYPNWDQACLTAGSPDGAACPYPVITTAVAYNGTHSLLTHYATAGVQAGSYYDRSITTSSRSVWTRQYARWDNFTFGPDNSKLFFLGAIGGATVVWLNQYAGAELYPVVNHTTTVTCPSGISDLSCNYYPNQGHSIPLDDGVWHCIETHQDYGTSGVANGSIDLYIDGVQTVHYTGVLMDTLNLNVDYIRTYAQYGLGDRYQDDWAVGDARIGCAGGGGGGSTAGGGLDF